MNQEEFERYKVTIDVLLGQHPTIEQGETSLEDLTIESIHEYMRYGSTGTKEYTLTLDDQRLREVITGLEGRLAHYHYNIGLDEQRSDLNELSAGRLERCRRSLASTQTLRDALWIIYLKGR